MARLCAVFVICTVAMWCANLQTVNAATVHKRSALLTSDVTKGEDGSFNACSKRTPCGWGVYQPFTRVVSYFMRNTCSCLPGQTCSRSEDDVSVSAYIYRCTTPPAGERVGRQAVDHRAGDTNI
uniref:Putative secreted protein n=1 Tax=Xenopsylla cheopis TaxID=163159 RepID=A0A6M2DWR5_XENCH